jgi:hypothetical protein
MHPQFAPPPVIRLKRGPVRSGFPFLPGCQERGAKSANHRNKKGSPAYSVLGSNGNHTKMQ